jgi:hypothetical protein
MAAATVLARWSEEALRRYQDRCDLGGKDAIYRPQHQARVAGGQARNLCLL